MEPERSGWARCCGSREGVAVDAVDDNAVLGAGDGRDGLMKPPPPLPPPTRSMLGLLYLTRHKKKNIFLFRKLSRESQDIHAIAILLSLLLADDKDVSYLSRLVIRLDLPDNFDQTCQSSFVSFRFLSQKNDETLSFRDFLLVLLSQ
jgi:hypothetical protein